MSFASGDLSVVLDDRTRLLIELRATSEPHGRHRRGWLVRRALLVADVVGLSVACILVELIVGSGDGSGRFSSVEELVAFGLFLPLWVVAAKIYRLYDRDEERTDHSTADDFAGVFHLVTVGTFLLFAVSSATSWLDLRFEKVFLFWLFAVVIVTTSRFVARAYCHTRIEYLQNTIIVGAGDVGQSIARKVLKHPEYGINLVGFVDATPRDAAPDIEHVAMLGDPSELPRLARLLDIERVIFAFSQEEHGVTLDLIRAMNDLDIQVAIVPRLFEVLGMGVDVHTLEGVPVIGLPAFRLSGSSRLLKRGLDIVVSAVALVLLAPVFVVIAAAIKFDSRGPVFFRQQRALSRDDHFMIWKFRTMGVDAEELKDALRIRNVHARPGGDPRMFKIWNDPRVTRVGRVLRELSLDELPQLLNVLMGQMSLVGPRPLIPEEDKFVVEDWERRRLDLKPGMTGMWQVLGRSEIPFAEMIRLDYLYVTTWSLFLDLRLILRTIPVVVRRAHTG
jgi:exopolysaccharide biosynthesis polyprenyl glycosylphosphotransferase